MNMRVLVALAVIALPLFWQSALAEGLQLKPYTFTSDSGETVKAQWGTLTVPLHHGEKNSRTLELSFVRFESTSSDPGYPIVYLAGGPGGSGIAAAGGERFPMFMALRQVADVIVLDQRGTGASDTIPRCSVPASWADGQTVRVTRKTQLTFFRQAVKHCVSFWRDKGVDLSAYNTRQNALDLETLRKALGVQKLNLLGISYGSTLALAALKVMPKHINRVVLASPLAVWQTVRLPARTQDFLERVAALLRSDPQLGKVYPDLTRLMDSVLSRLEKEPVHITMRSLDGQKRR